MKTLEVISLAMHRLYQIIVFDDESKETLVFKAMKIMQFM